MDGPDRPAPKGLTSLLQLASAGDREAQSRLLPLVDRELRKIARFRLHRLRPGQTLTATVLSHDAYLRLLGANVPWQSRKHFFSTASKVMRGMLVSQARRRGRLKRGGALRRVELSETIAGEEGRGLDLLALDEALRRLEEDSPEQHEVVMLRYFCGLSVDEAAEVLAVSPSTVDRQWRFARAWLLRELG